MNEIWKTGQISDFFELQRGFDLTEKQAVNGSIPVYSSSGLAYYHNEPKIVPPGVVTGRKGSLGKVYYIETSFWPHDTTLWVKNFKGNHPKFVKYFLDWMHLEKFDAASSVPTLNRQNVHCVKCKFPPLPEQIKITEILSTWDKAVAQTQRLIEAKGRLKQGLMQQLLMGQLRFKEFTRFSNGLTRHKQTIVGLVPVDWEVKQLGDIGSFSKGQGIRKDESNSGDIPCIRYGELYTKHNNYIKNYYSFISEEISQESKILKKGDILFAGSGEKKEEIGKCASFIDDILAYAGGDIVIFSPENVDSLFLGYLLNSSPIVKQKSRKGQGDAIVHVSAKNLQSIFIALPSLLEQQKIAHVLLITEKGIDTLNEQLTLLLLQKKSTMQKLLTGQIRVKVGN